MISTGICQIVKFCDDGSHAETPSREALRVTPAMESGLSDHVWSIEEMCALLPKAVSSASRIDRALILKVVGASF
jgi:hypothetical protein